MFFLYNRAWLTGNTPDCRHLIQTNFISSDKLGHRFFCFALVGRSGKGNIPASRWSKIMAGSRRRCKQSTSRIPYLTVSWCVLFLPFLPTNLIDTRVWGEIARICFSVRPFQDSQQEPSITLCPHSVHSHPACTGRNYKLWTDAWLAHAHYVALAMPSIDYVGRHGEHIVVVRHNEHNHCQISPLADSSSYYEPEPVTQQSTSKEAIQGPASVGKSLWFRPRLPLTPCLQACPSSQQQGSSEPFEVIWTSVIDSKRSSVGNLLK